MKIVQYARISVATVLIATGLLVTKVDALEGFWMSASTPDNSLPEFLILSEGMVLSGVTTAPSRGPCISEIFVDRLCILAIGKFELGSGTIRFFQLQPGLNSSWARYGDVVNDTFLSTNDITFRLRDRGKILNMAGDGIDFQLVRTGEIISSVSAAYAVLSSRFRTQQEKALAANLLEVNSHYLDLQSALMLNDISFSHNHECVLEVARNSNFVREARVSAQILFAYAVIREYSRAYSDARRATSFGQGQRLAEELEQSEYPPFVILGAIIMDALGDSLDLDSKGSATISMAEYIIGYLLSDREQERIVNANSGAASQVAENFLQFGGLSETDLGTYSSMLEESGLLDLLNCAD